MPDPIRVVIADDHPIFLHGLRKVIGVDPLLRVVAEATDGEDALRRITTEQPDVAVLDLAMPLKNGFDVARAVRDANLSLAIVFLTLHRMNTICARRWTSGQEGTCRRMARCWRSGPASRRWRRDRCTSAGDVRPAGAAHT